MLRDILQQLSFGQRLVLYRLLIALAISGVIYYYFFVPKPGERALERAEKALQGAYSWKVEYTVSNPEQTYKIDFLMEVQCPSSERTTEHMSGAPGGVPQDWTHITMTVKGASYEYTNPATGWVRTAAGLTGPVVACQKVAHAEEYSMFPPYATWRRRGFVEKGELRDTGIGQCQDWKVVIPGGRNSPSHTSHVCIGQEDLLPRYVQDGGREFRYYDWNVPIQLQEPVLAGQLNR